MKELVLDAALAFTFQVNFDHKRLVDWIDAPGSPFYG